MFYSTGSSVLAMQLESSVSNIRHDVAQIKTEIAPKNTTGALKQETTYLQRSNIFVT